MSNRVKEEIKKTLLQQQAALDNAIERGNIGMQWAIVQHMCVLENALEAADGIITIPQNGTTTYTFPQSF